MDGAAEVGAAPPWGFDWGRAVVPALSPHTAPSYLPPLLAPAVLGSHIKPQTPGEGSLGARFHYSQLPTCLGLGGCSIPSPPL